MICKIAVDPSSCGVLQNWDRGYDRPDNERYDTQADDTQADDGAGVDAGCAHKKEACGGCVKHKASRYQNPTQEKEHTDSERASVIPLYQLRTGSEYPPVGKI
jgi:hypothetical protein